MISDEQLKKLRTPQQASAPAWTLEDATDKQLGYIKGMIEDRDVPEAWLERIKELVEVRLTKGKAGEIISALKKLPIKRADGENRAKNAPTVADIPPGRYAVQTGEHENDLTFYRVRERQDKSDRENNRKYIMRMAGPNEYYLGVISAEAKAAAKQIVRAGIGDSAVLYGRKVGRCSQCNTRITNRLSRELGIGPVCGGRVYQDWDIRVNRARAALRELGFDPSENVEE